MKKIYILMLIMVLNVFANNCKNWENTSDNCLNDTTIQKPKFNNTESYMQIGDVACRTYDDKYYTFKDSITLKNGLMIKILLPRQVCREIINIEPIRIPSTIRVPRTKIDFDCCDRAHADDMRLYGSNTFKIQCYHGEWDAKCKQIQYVDSTIYTNAYHIEYADSARIGFDFTEKSKIELSADYYVENDFVEIYRDDGTLKYKGELLYEEETAEKLPTYKTRGWCYNKTGTKETRKTNNVTLCK